ALVRFLVGNDADCMAADPRIAAQNSAAKFSLILIELATIDNSGDHLAHLVDIRSAWSGIQQSIEIVCCKFWRIHSSVESASLKAPGSRARSHLRHQRTQPRQAEMIVRLFEVDRAGNFGVHCRASQLLWIGLLSNGRLHKRRTGKKQP